MPLFTPVNIETLLGHPVEHFVETKKPREASVMLGLSISPSRPCDVKWVKKLGLESSSDSSVNFHHQQCPKTFRPEKMHFRFNFPLFEVLRNFRNFKKFLQIIV